MIVPAYVVVDTIDGMVFTNDGEEKFNDPYRAFKFADKRNKEMKPEYQTYKVFRLVQAQREEKKWRRRDE
jgi:hypothetical protein